MKNINFLKKLSLSAVIAAAVMGLTACNSDIKVRFDCTAGDYITVENYKGITVNVDTDAIADGLVDKRIKNDLDKVTEYSEVSRAAQDEDKLTLKFTGSVGGHAVDGFSSDSYTLTLGKDTFTIPGFTDELYGMMPGEQKIVTLTIPEGIADAEAYANKRIVYEITMVKIEQPIVPMLTDAYAKEYFGHDTLDAYRQAIVDEIRETIDENIASAKKQAVLEKLQDNAQIKGYPENILNTKSEELKNSINFYAIMYQMNEDEYCRDRYGMSFEEYVKKSVAQDLALQYIVEKEGIKVTEYEYKDDLDAFAEANGFSDEKDFVNKFGRDKIVKNMLIQKAVDLVMENAVFN